MLAGPGEACPGTCVTLCSGGADGYVRNAVLFSSVDGKDTTAGDWITAPTAAKLLGLRVNTVYKMIDSGTLHAERGALTTMKRGGQVSLRRHVRLRRQDVDDFLERAKVKPGELRGPYLRAIGRHPDGNK